MRRLMCWTWLALAGVVMAAPADAQLLLDRLFLLPGVVEGPGQVRLKGMGGFQIAVPDENNEINLWDYAQNPAGYGDDRDSWGLDTRYTHDEFVDRSLTSTRDDLNFNTGFLELGYRRPGKIGVGGRLIYSELDARIVEAASTSYQLSGFSLFINKYFGQNVSVGAGFTSRGDTRDEVTNAVYNINHSGSRVNGILGVAYTPVEGVLLGGKAELGQSTIDGESIGPFHTDTFEWTRPTSLVAVHGFLNRGRLNLGADFSRGNLEGDETVRASWSERFVFNPTNEVITFEATTFTEERTETRARARAFLDVVPGTLRLSGALESAKHEIQVRTTPNIQGSLGAQDDEVSQTQVSAGAAWTLLESRLLLAGELAVGSSDYTRRVRGEDQVDNRNTSVFRAGSEYMFGETVIGRGGIILTRDDFDIFANPSASKAYNSSRVALGLGLVPAGAIWQFDFAYELLLNSDLDADGSQFSAYMRYLF